MEEKFLQSVKKEMRLKGLKLTGPRLAILDYLVRIKGHPNVQEICEGLRMESPGIGMATVYRTVDLLMEIGVLRALILKKSHLRYEVNWPGDHHHHLVCNGCGKVIEFGSCNFSSIVREIEKVTRYKVEEHNLEAYGFCPQCSEENPAYSIEKT